MPVDQYFRREGAPPPVKVWLGKPEDLEIVLPNRMRKDEPDPDVAPPTKHIIDRGKARGGKRGGRAKGGG